MNSLSASAIAPVVLLHASASSARQWEAARAALQPRFDVHTVEFHGHGTQPAWHGDEALTLADDAAHVEALLEQLGSAHLVGHSYGAAVALKLACRRPALVRSVVAYEPVLFGLLLDDAASRAEAQVVTFLAESVRRRLAHGDARSAAQAFIDFWSGAGSFAALSDERRAAFAARMPAVLPHFDALFGDPLAVGDLAMLPTPLLLLCGSRTVPAAQRIWMRAGSARPARERGVLEGLGHMGLLTHPDAFNRRVLDFLQARVEQAAGAPRRLAARLSTRVRSKPVLPAPASTS